MRILGIDPSTKCGLAVVESGKKILHTEQVEFKKLDGFERVQAIVARAMEVREQYQPDAIVIEDMFVGHASSAIVTIQIGSFIRYFLWQEDILYIDVPATNLKQFASGTGSATKEQMMMNVLKHWGHESKTNNIADAVCLGMAGLALLGDTFTKTMMTPLVKVREMNHEVLKKLQK